MMHNLPREQLRDWGQLPAVSLQCLGRHCCLASKAKLRAVCKTWHDAMTTQFTELYLGPGNLWSHSQKAEDHPPTASSNVICRPYPAAQSLHITASSTRDYPATYTQDLAGLLCRTSGLTHLSLQELHELEDFDNLDVTSLWDALDAAVAAPGGFAGRLIGLSVSDCFWNTPELFGVLKQLSGLTQLRLANNPLETACEVGIIASLTHLQVLEFGIIFDGSSQHHDVPRALEQISNLTRLQDLSIPMWRRSLGGRAHPLAPSLAVVLGKLTALTSLAVDGKFGHLTVVNCLTNLRRLASAAPLSAEGWQAISQLPQLTLLTSITPTAEPLRLNPSRPHKGLDLGLLCSKTCLRGLDVAVMQPEHLATLGQFTALQSLCLRCAHTFQQPQHQAQILTALSCLPSGITHFNLGPLLPLSPQLLITIAQSCPLLKTLSARFTHVAGCCVSAAGFERGLHRRTSIPGAAAAAAGGLVAAAAAAGDVKSAACDTDDTCYLTMDNIAADPLTIADDDAMCVDEEQEAAAAGSSSSSISTALQRFKGLTNLELVLVTEDDGEDDVMYGSSGGGSSSRPPSNAGVCLMAAAGGVATHGHLISTAMKGSVPCAQLQLDYLPHGLKQLVLTGPWQLSLSQVDVLSTNTTAAAAAAAGSSGVQQQQQRCCAVCGKAASAEGSDAGGNTVLQLCKCIQGLELGYCAAAAAAAVSQEGSNSPVRSGRPTSGHKRPGSYTLATAAAAGGGGGGGSAVDVGGPEMPSAAAAAAAAAMPVDDVFWMDDVNTSGKRSRSHNSLEAHGAVTGQEQAHHGSAGGSGSSSSRRASDQHMQQLSLPVLSGISLYQCHIQYNALVQLVATAGTQLRKLLLLRLHTNAQAAAAAAAVGMTRASRLSSSGSSSSSSSGSSGVYQDPSEMNSEQLQLLPVCWSHLEEWHLHPHHLWGLLRSGHLSGSSSSSTVSDYQQQLSSHGLFFAHQLLNLRHLYITNRPASFAAACPAVKDHRWAEAVIVMPLHHRPAVEQLLQQLQQSLQQMPALRQLLLYMGHVTKQQPDMPNNCQELWTEAGERLLEGLPACRVKHYAPVVCAMGFRPEQCGVLSARGRSPTEAVVQMDYAI